MSAAAPVVLVGKICDGSLDPPIEHGAVAIDGETIAWVGSVSELPERFARPDVTRLERPGRTIMPGLVDGHLHISFGEARSEEELALYTSPEYRTARALWHARKVLRAGVTSAFDAATTFHVAPAVRDAIEAGMFEGPRLSVAGRQLTTHQGLEDAFPSWVEFPKGQAGVLVRDRDEIIEAIRVQVKDGVDAIKVSGSSDSAVFDDPLQGAAFRPEEFELIAEETHRLGRVCTVHARSRDSVLFAAAAKFDWIMHASYIDDAGIELCLKHDIAITPALTLLMNIVESSKGSRVGASVLDVFKAEIDAASENLGRAYRAGVKLISGSETGWSLVPYGQWHAREMQIMVENFGLTPLQAIHAGTMAATRCLPRLAGRIGQLAIGRLADLLVIDGDPTTDITVLQHPERFDMVIKGGVVVDTTTPIAERRVWSHERHKTYLAGRYMFDREAGTGLVVP